MKWNFALWRIFPFVGDSSAVCGSRVAFDSVKNDVVSTWSYLRKRGGSCTSRWKSFSEQTSRSRWWTAHLKLLVRLPLICNRDNCSLVAIIDRCLNLQRQNASATLANLTVEELFTLNFATVWKGKFISLDVRLIQSLELDRDRKMTTFLCAKLLQDAWKRTIQALA